jgi:hypothetical protein
VASTQNPEDSKVMIPTPAIKSLHPPLEKGETIDTIMTTTPLPGTQKRPHELDNSIDDFRGEISLMGEIKGPLIFYWANFLY